jgi:hypothetical protein
MPNIEHSLTVDIDSKVGPKIPKDVWLVDVSLNEKHIALIDHGYSLKVYKLDQQNRGHTTIKTNVDSEFHPVNVGFIDDIIYPVYAYLSIASDGSRVALSFVQMSEDGDFDSRLPQQPNCYIYEKDGTTKEVPCNGRAVFVDDGLVIIKKHSVEFLDKDLKRKYILDTTNLTKGFEALINPPTIIKNTAWAKSFHVKARKPATAGENLITMSRHIQSNILITPYRKNIVRIWSILDGTLITSYKTENSEYIMAISEDQRYIATFDGVKNVAKIYCSKSSLLLHTIEPVAVNAPMDNTNKTGNFTISSMRFCNVKRNLIISGFKTFADNTKPLQKQNSRKVTFEMWSISSQINISYFESTYIPGFTMQPFIIIDQEEEKALTAVPYTSDIKPDMPNTIPEPQQTTNNRTSNKSKTRKNIVKHSSQYFNSKYSGIYPVEDDDNEYIRLELYDIPLLKNKGIDSPNVHTPGAIKWKEYELLPESRNITAKNPHEITDTLDKTNDLLCYYIDIQSFRYVLRFGNSTVQLWRLNPVADLTLSKPDELFQLTIDGTSKHFYKSLEKNDLVYIRAYKGHDYNALSSFRDHWQIKTDKKRPAGLLFMEDVGRIMVNVEMVTDFCRHTTVGGSNPGVRRVESYLRRERDRVPKSVKIKMFDMDEIFLPIEKLDQDYLTNHQSSACDFHEIESAALALHSLYCLKKKSVKKVNI